MSALAGHLNLLLAGQVGRAGRRVARRVARMLAQFPLLLARLATARPVLGLAATAVVEAGSLVAGLDAVVPPARERPVARPAARQALDVAGDALAQLVSAVAALLGERRAGRAALLGVAVVHHVVRAVVGARAAVGALWRPRAARDRREEDLLAAPAAQLVEGDAVALLAVAPVAGVVAAVEAAAEQAAADEGAGVVEVDAAHLAALVPPALTLLGAALLAAGVVAARLELRARKLAVHEAAAAADVGGQRAGRARADVTGRLALVTAVLLGQVAHLAAGGNRVEAGLAPLEVGVGVVEFLQVCLAARTFGDLLHGEWTWLAVSVVADGLAFVVATVQPTGADLAAGVLRLDGGSAGHLAILLPAIAFWNKNFALKFGTCRWQQVDDDDIRIPVPHNHMLSTY